MTNATQTAFTHLIDYAGLFPPAALDLPTTIDNYARYHQGPDAWALGNLILSANHVQAFTQRWPDHATHWPIAVLIRTEAELTSTLNLTQSSNLHLAAVECSNLKPSAIHAIAYSLPETTDLYIEAADGPALSETLAAISQANAKAKLRTGALSADAIPSATAVARFLCCCVQHSVPFKATAGLHHALRGTHPLTNEPHSPSAPMHGFLNLLLASTLLHNGANTTVATSLLEETSLANFTFAPDRIHWQDYTFTAHQLLSTRQDLFRSFGSCSFTEPLNDLRAAGLLA